MTKAYSYIRMSTQEQLKGDSLRRQTDRATQYCKTHNLDLDDTFKLTDIGLSAFDGSNLKNGTLGLFLEAVQQGRIEKGSVLVLESLDRLSRLNPRAALPLFLSILAAGVSIVTLIDGRTFQHDSVDSMELYISLGIMTRANEESASKSDRQKQSWHNKRKNAHLKNLTKVCPGWLRPGPDNRGFEELPDRAKIVRGMFLKATDMGWGAQRIASDLNRRRVPPFGKSKAWAKSSIKKILKSKAVIGQFMPCTKQNGRRVPTEQLLTGYYPAIITEELYLATQHKISQRGMGGGGNTGAGNSNLFTKLAKCGYCGASMVYLDKGAKGGRVLQCSTAHKRAGCTNITWRYDEVEKWALTFLREIDLRSLTGEFIHRDELAKLGEAVKVERGRLLDAERLRRRVFELVTGEAPTTFLRDELIKADQSVADISARIVQLEGEELSLKGQNRAFVEGGHEMEGLIAQVQDSKSGDSSVLRSRISSKMRDILKSITLYAGGLVLNTEKVADLRRQIRSDVQFPAPDGESLVAYITEANRLRKERRCMIFGFRDGSSRGIAPRFDDPGQFIVIAETEVSTEGRQSVTSSWGDLQDGMVANAGDGEAASQAKS